MRTVRSGTGCVIVCHHVLGRVPGLTWNMAQGHRQRLDEAWSRACGKKLTRGSRTFCACVSLPHRSLSPPGPGTRSPAPRALGHLEGRAGGPGWLPAQAKWTGGEDHHAGPRALNATFPGPLPTGHYALELRVLAGPYDA